VQRKQGKRKEYPIATVDCWIRSQWLSVMDVSYDEHCVKQACIMQNFIHIIVTTVTGCTSTIGCHFVVYYKTSIEKDVSRDSKLFSLCYRSHFCIPAYQILCDGVGGREISMQSQFVFNFSDK